MNNILKTLVENSHRAIDDRVYDSVEPHEKSDVDLVERIRDISNAPIITEVKFASPSEGKICENIEPEDVAIQMVDGGAVALSVLTQPHMFGGSPENLARIRKKVSLPILMKDIIIDPKQIEAGAKMGADYILLIESVFESNESRDKLVEIAHSHGLGVLLESHTKSEFESALGSDADMIGINNRDLDTLKISLDTTEQIMAGFQGCSVPIVTESGISSPDDIRRLRACGADVFLVGTSIMKSEDIGRTVRSLASAI